MLGKSLKQWFKKATGSLPSADELTALMDVWGRSGHIDLVPQEGPMEEYALTPPEGWLTPDARSGLRCRR